ncbi:hypothetical protein HNR46_001346 [Haloferula luteola]|uniref:Uncharacterized protein n=1 Tax=Haloferula luteola TaxID=595692 RepID=A0A840UZA8_9BACT|nr:hypothetical protein [Haloferula luteola]MBB5351112.1 hypothetical protein [Haloferula luteola]
MAPRIEYQPNYEEGRSYLVKGSLLNGLIRHMGRARMIPGTGIEAISTPSGTVWNAVPSESFLCFHPHISEGELKLSPGTVTYVRIFNENEQDPGEDEGSSQMVPEFPTINDVALNADPAPGFDVSSLGNCSLWICYERSKCGFSGQGGTGNQTARIELHPRGARPERAPGEGHRLIAEMDLLEDIEGGRIIDNLDWRIRADIEVPFGCTEDTSSFDPEDEASSMDSSDEVDDHPSDSSVSDSDCPWAFTAEWINKRDCYPEFPPGDSPVIGIKIRVRATRVFSKCVNWFVYIRCLPGKPKPYDNQGQDGDWLKVALSAPIVTIGARFYFTSPPHCTGQTVEVRLRGEPDPEDLESHECCNTDLGPRSKYVGNWPRWCSESSCSG